MTLEMQIFGCRVIFKPKVSLILGLASFLASIRTEFLFLLCRLRANL